VKRAIWHPLFLWVCLVLPTVLLANLAQAETDNSTLHSVAQRIGSGNVARGKLKIQTENCQECHGEFGVGLGLTAPKLAGQFADYLIKQLNDFQTGERKHPVMTVMAESLSDDDKADIAAYYASHPVMRGEESRPSLLAKDIFMRGDMTRNIVSCKTCHGETGKGKFSPTECYPVIGGQHMIYLREQLRNWRSGARSNSSTGVMNIIAKQLSDSEIQALSDYLSGF